MKDLAVVTVMFDCEADRKPRFWDNALKYFDIDDIYVARPSGLNDHHLLKLYKYKIHHLLAYLIEHVLNKYKYCLFMDAFDTNFYRDPSLIIEDFRALNKSIVFCAERELFPFMECCWKYERKPSGVAKHLNSGVYIGLVDKIVLNLAQIVAAEYYMGGGDQGGWTSQYLLDANVDIEVDRDCELFFSTWRAMEYVTVTDDKAILNGINPYVIHDNGNGGLEQRTIKIAHLL